MPSSWSSSNSILLVSILIKEFKLVRGFNFFATNLQRHLPIVVFVDEYNNHHGLV